MLVAPKPLIRLSSNIFYIEKIKLCFCGAFIGLTPLIDFLGKLPVSSQNRQFSKSLQTLAKWFWVDSDCGIFLLSVRIFQMTFSPGLSIIWIASRSCLVRLNSNLNVGGKLSQWKTNNYIIYFNASPTVVAILSIDE